MELSFGSILTQYIVGITWIDFVRRVHDRIGEEEAAQQFLKAIGVI